LTVPRIFIKRGGEGGRGRREERRKETCHSGGVGVTVSQAHSSCSRMRERERERERKLASARTSAEGAHARSAGGQVYARTSAVGARARNVELGASDPHPSS
jgi:hypothetical protein